MGKSCRLPFLPRENEIKIPFYKIHCDLWGPAPISSREKFHYYKIFVDELPILLGFSLWKEVRIFNYFDLFYKYVECQFKAKICVFQSDEGGEFANCAFLQFLATKGIHRQSACPKTLEQNGKAERKHWNITELGLTMMFHAYLPPRFWTDCFSTVVFLINRLPSPHLNMESPFFRFYGRNLDYSLLRVLAPSAFLTFVSIDHISLI